MGNRGKKRMGKEYRRDIVVCAHRERENEIEREREKKRERERERERKRTGGDGKETIKDCCLKKIWQWVNVVHNGKQMRITKMAPERHESASLCSNCAPATCHSCPLAPALLGAHHAD